MRGTKDASLSQPSRWRRVWLGLAIAGGAIGCQSAPTEPGAPAVSDEGAAAPRTEGPAHRRLAFDIDPLRAAAFERPDDRADGALPALVTAPAVRHDPASGHTMVHLEVAASAVSEPHLTAEAVGGAVLLTPPVALAPFGPAGAVQPVDLVFDNPGATAFALSLDLAGTAGTVAEAPRRVLLATGIVSVSASSSMSGFAPARAIDGDLSTQWSAGGYRANEATLTLDFGTSRSLSALKVKMPPQSGGAFYRLETSSDGSSYKAVTGSLKSTSWNLETKSLPAGTQGRFLRLHFVNDASSPEAHFSVFEAQVVFGSGAVSSPTPAPTPAPTSVPTSGTGGLSNTFEQYSPGSDPSDFIDPRNEGYSYSWMPQVPWRVTSYNGSMQYMHDGLANQGYLSFRRYRGTALGLPNGQLPTRYFAQVDVTPIKSNSYSPTGDQGTQFYYLDPTHYVELLIKPTMFEVWVCNGGVPFQSTGWQRIYFTSMSTAGGQKRVLAAEIDAGTHSLKAYFDGVLRTSQTVGLMTTQTHFLALRGTGNVVVHDNLRIQAR